MTSLTTNDLFSVSGKVVLVTGGSRGIGEMIAAGFLANGAKVYISSRKRDVCDATAARLAAEYGGECISIPADVSDLDGIDALVAQLSEREIAPRCPRQQRGSLVGSAHRRVPRGGLGQGHGHQRQGRLLPHATAAALARGGGQRRGPRTGDQHRVGRRDPHAVVRHRVLRARRRRRCTPSRASWPGSWSGATSSSTPSRRGRSRPGCSAPAWGPGVTWTARTGRRWAARCRGAGGDARGHRRSRHLPGVEGRCLHRWCGHHLRRGHRRLLTTSGDGRASRPRAGPSRLPLRLVPATSARWPPTCRAPCDAARRSAGRAGPRP